MTIPEPDAAMERLANRLLERTQAGLIPWDETDRQNGYIFSSTGSSVTITKTTDVGGRPQYNLTLINSSGVEAARLRTSYYNIGGEVQPGRWNSLLQQLYEAVRKDVLDLDNALKDMFGALGGMGDEGTN